MMRIPIVSGPKYPLLRLAFVAVLITLGLTAAMLSGCDPLAFGDDEVPTTTTGVVYVNGHPITAAEIEERRAGVADGLESMREQILEAEGSSWATTDLAQFFKERVALIEEHSVDAVTLGGLIREASVFTAAVAAGHMADPAELADALEQQAEYIEDTKAAIERGHLPEDATKILEFDYDRYLSEVLPNRLIETLPVNNWRAQLTAQAWNREEENFIWHNAEQRAVMIAEVIFTSDPVIQVTREAALAYLEDYFTTLAPPPVPDPICANGITITEPRDNRLLVFDCEVLLEFKKSIRGTASLDWSIDVPITDWTGITIGSEPKQVTRVALLGKGLFGGSGAPFAHLSALVSLDLAGNSLEFQREHLAGLSDLKKLYLAGNLVYDCIPLELLDLESHDLDSLGIDYCLLPTPWRLDSDIPTRTSVFLSWAAVPNATGYRVEYEQGHGGYSISNGQLIGDWLIADDTITSTSHTVKGLACGTSYTFFVRACLGGSTQPMEWSRPSLPMGVSTGACQAPVPDKP